MKRATKRRLRQATLYALLVVIVVALALLADWQAIKENFFDVHTMKEIWPEIVQEGAKNTIIYTAIAFTGGLALAFVLALMKLSPVAPYRWLATVYIEFFRGLPALIVITRSPPADVSSGAARGTAPSRSEHVSTNGAA